MMMNTASSSSSFNLSDGHNNNDHHHHHHHHQSIHLDQAQQQQQHRQLTKLSSDSNVMLAGSASTSTLSTSLGYNTNSDSASSFGLLTSHTSESQATLRSKSSYQLAASSSGSKNLSPAPVASHSGSKLSFAGDDVSQPPAIGPLRKAIKSMIPQILHSNNQEGSHTKRTLKQTSSSTARASFEADEAIHYHGAHSKSLSSIEYHQHETSSGRNSSSSSRHRDSLPSSQTLNKLRVSSQESGNYTLLLQHSLQPETSFKSGEICAICENSIAVGSGQNSHYKCSECRQLFHDKCLHLNRDIPCCLSSPDSSSSSVLAGKLK